jgi:hypothetical protein
MAREVGAVGVRLPALNQNEAQNFKREIYERREKQKDEEVPRGDAEYAEEKEAAGQF